jgi:FKBP-type peptidyl-prolyl cis-trans isomerase
MRNVTLRFDVLAVAAILALAACEQKVPEPTPEPRKETPAEPSVPEPPDLVKEDSAVGTGAEAKSGDKVKVNYTGRLLKTNFIFDTSVGKKPFEFEIGKGAVIKGWDEGVLGMRVGGKRKLTIPSRLGYGDAGSPPKIPGKATLVFDVELLQIGEDKDAGASDGGTSKDGGAKPAGAKDGGAKKKKDGG